MGSPKKFRKKYSNPSHPWQKERIVEEVELTKEFGFGKKKEIYKAVSILSSFKRQAKRLSALKTEQAKKETEQLFKKLQKLQLLGSEPSYDAVLEISLKDLASRRLQSVLVARGLARSPKQARQFIVHNHVTVNNKKISSPSYLVCGNDIIAFSEKSNLSKEDHPERFKQEIEELAEEVEKVKPKKSEKTESSEEKTEDKEEVKEEKSAEVKE